MESRRHRQGSNRKTDITEFGQGLPKSAQLTSLNLADASRISLNESCLFRSLLSLHHLRDPSPFSDPRHFMNPGYLKRLLFFPTFLSYNLNNELSPPPIYRDTCVAEFIIPCLAVMTIKYDNTINVTIYVLLRMSCHMEWGFVVLGFVFLIFRYEHIGACHLYCGREK